MLYELLAARLSTWKRTALHTLKRHAAEARRQEKLRKRREEEKAWKRLGVIPTRRVTWKGLVVDVDGTRGIGYYPKILRDLPKAPPK